MKNGAFTIHTLTLSLTLTTCSLTPTLHSPPQAHTFPNTLTHAAVSMSLIAAGTGVVGLAWGVSHTSRDLVGWIRGRDYWGRARETQVATIMVEALHLTLTRLWDCFTFIYVWDGKSNVSEIWYFFFFKSQEFIFMLLCNKHIKHKICTIIREYGDVLPLQCWVCGSQW